MKPVKGIVSNAFSGINSAMTDVRSSTTSNSGSFVSRSKSKFERKSFVLGSSSLGSSRLAKIGFGVNKAVELFNKIAFLIYDRFKQEAVIDLRVKEVSFLLVASLLTPSYSDTTPSPFPPPFPPPLYSSGFHQKYSEGPPLDGGGANGDRGDHESSE